MSYFGTGYGGAVGADSESCVPDAGADAPSASTLFGSQQSHVPPFLSASNNSTSPQVQISLADLKQVYLDALQTYHQQLLQQAAAASPFGLFGANPFLLSGGLNVQQLMQLQLLAQQQQQAQAQQQFSAAASGLSFNLQAAAPAAPSLFSAVPQQMPSVSRVSTPNSPAVFAVPRPVEEVRAAREARIQKYRAKRLKRKQSRPSPLVDKNCSPALRLRDIKGQFIAKDRVKPDRHDLETKLAVTESECEKLRQSLTSKESELSNIKQMLDEQIQRNEAQMNQLQQLMQATMVSGSQSMPQLEQQRMLHDQLAAQHRNLQMQQHQVSMVQAQVQEALSEQMQVDSYQSPPMSASPGAASPATPATPMAIVSTPSTADDEMEMDTSVHMTSSVSSPLSMDDADDETSHSAKHLLTEKLKKLGGPPSDVYYPYWPGFIMHPAFLQKEDWTNMTLRPTGLDPDVLEQERRRYFEAQQQWQQEQERIAALLVEHPELLNSANALAGTWRPGYWAGNWVPAAEKIDFSKIELRKTTTEGSSVSRPATTTSEAMSQLQQALARRAALEAAAMSAASAASAAASSNSSAPAQSSTLSSSSSALPHRSSTFSGLPPSSPASHPHTPTLSSPSKPIPRPRRTSGSSQPAPMSPSASPSSSPSSPSRIIASPAALIWREFLRSHSNAIQQQSISSSSSSAANPTSRPM